MLTRQDGRWHARAARRGCPSSARSSATAVDDEESDDYFLTVTDYVTPDEPLARHGRQGAGGEAQAAAGVLRRDRARREPARGDLEGRHAHPVLPGVAPDAGARRHEPDAALRLRRLRGLRCCPPTAAASGAAWLEKGGVYVVANIRGGGEFGPKWHQAALKANRHRAYEDFIAVARGPDPAQGHEHAAPRHPGRQQRRAADGQHAHDAARPVRRRRVPGAAARHAPLPHAARRRELDGRVRRPGRPGGVGVHPGLLALPPARRPA